MSEIWTFHNLQVLKVPLVVSPTDCGEIKIKSWNTKKMYKTSRMDVWKRMKHVNSCSEMVCSTLLIVFLLYQERRHWKGRGDHVLPPSHLTFFRSKKIMKKERVSKQKLLKSCHQGKDVTVLVILERLEFKHFFLSANHGGRHYFWNRFRRHYILQLL